VGLVLFDCIVKCSNKYYCSLFVIIVYCSKLFGKPVAKCNFGKVKFEPMLLAGCVLSGQWITSKRMCYDAGWSKGFGTAPSLGWLLACVFANHLILLIVADH